MGCVGLGYSLQFHRWPLSEMFQKVQLAAMKNDKFHWVATVNAKPNLKPNPKSGEPLSSLLASVYWLSFIIYQAYYESSSSI